MPKTRFILFEYIIFQEQKKISFCYAAAIYTAPYCHWKRVYQNGILIIEEWCESKLGYSGWCAQNLFDFFFVYDPEPMYEQLNLCTVRTACPCSNIRPSGVMQIFFFSWLNIKPKWTRKPRYIFFFSTPGSYVLYYIFKQFPIL